MKSLYIKLVFALIFSSLSLCFSGQVDNLCGYNNLSYPEKFTVYLNEDSTTTADIAVLGEMTIGNIEYKVYYTFIRIGGGSSTRGRSSISFCSTSGGSQVEYTFDYFETMKPFRAAGATLYFKDKTGAITSIELEDELPETLCFPGNHCFTQG